MLLSALLALAICYEFTAHYVDLNAKDCSFKNLQILLLLQIPRIYLPCTHQQTQTRMSPSQNKSQNSVQLFQPPPMPKKKRLKVHAGVGVGHKCHVHTQPTTTSSTTTPTPAPGRKSNKKEKPDVGLEPTTLRLRVSRATDCASRAYCEEKLLLDFHEE
jgi:hypothetical protein